ncbi:MAG: NADH-ubiquinone oxidoreductase-F iron-sulfur binding region domain-containing protein [Bacilli bacterium]
MMLERTQVLICGGTGCLSSKALEIKNEFEKNLKELGIKDEVGVVLTGCFGLCEKGPIVIVYPDETFYSKVKVDDVARICEEHLYKGRIVKDLVFEEVLEDDIVKAFNDIGFYRTQKRIALRNCGVINPFEIEEYIANDGYFALASILEENTPEDVIDIMKKSGLRGRGGGGFPTGMKWEFAAKEESEQKYVLCNADEGDPGAFMDRAILEGDPHSVIEAMAICGYAIGASQGYFYIRAEYPIAVERVEHALKQAYEYGLLGKNIFDSGFSFDLEVRLGAGAFVCGEETALIASIEGERGMPRNKPPFPAVKGLFQEPTIINNVETLANIPIIINKGADWYSSIGTEESPGTKVFALGGKIANTGLVEVPMGTKLRDIIYNIGGGIPEGKEFKAVQTGGPSGGVIPKEHLDVAIEYQTLKDIGTMMGSGGMIVLDETDCIVDIAKFYLEFTCEESCGKCTPCRVGTTRLLEILEKITEGNGTEEDLVTLKNLSETIVDTSLCGLGKSAPNPILSTLNYFYDEYLAHVRDKKCPAGVCQNLLEIFITDSCIGCTKCSRVCPVDCIDGKVKELHVIDQDTCIKCSACIDACPVDAIIKR